MITRRSTLMGGTAGAIAMASGPAIAQSRSIEVWSQESPGKGSVVAQAIEYVVKSFEASHPGVELKITSMPWQQLSPTLLRASRAHRVPDVTMFYSPDMPVHIDAHTIMPLTDFMAGWSAEKRADILRLRQAQDEAGIDLRTALAGAHVRPVLSRGPAGEGGPPAATHPGRVERYCRRGAGRRRGRHGARLQPRRRIGGSRLVPHHPTGAGRAGAQARWQPQFRHAAS